MWLESVKRRIQAKNLVSIADRLDASGLIKEFYIIIRKAKPVVTASYQNDFLSIIRILTEEVWKECKRSNSFQTDEQPKPQNLSLDKTFEAPPSSSNRIHKKTLSSIDIQSSSSPIKPLNTSLSKSRNESFFSSPKYKNQISQEIAYMSTFSYPKGIATFTKTRRVTSNSIPDVPGPGSYFCDPRLTQNIVFNSNKTPVPSCRSTKSLSLSLIKF
ncbi:hypothetical protein SteCoe_30838 [Stentor coeruleus]|uniref:Uncharacterized protein n=1 Tax=Stentor coeruleus TaxID=5963 RepID=A0A1R2B340_9CILI|nr:hypothetical protein SteCoe_30838 [Stentor coeruleus]